MPRTTTGRAFAAAAVALTLVLAGCRGGPTVDPADAKTTIVDVVEQTTAAIGGDWTVASGPRLGTCPQSDGGRGVVWVYIVERDSDDREADLDTVEALWRDMGMTTTRWQSGGDDPDTGVTGRGGSVSVIDFSTTARTYSLEGVSPCAAGDFDDLVDTDLAG